MFCFLSNVSPYFNVRKSIRWNYEFLIASFDPFCVSATSVRSYV